MNFPKVELVQENTELAKCFKKNQKNFLLKNIGPGIPEDVESVKTYKYLGTVLDSNLSFTTHVDTVCKKANQRMYLIRKLKTFDVDKKMLERIYRTLVESILTFNIVTFYGHLTVKQKNRLNKIVNIATKLINLKQKSLNDLYQQAISKKKQKHYK